MTLPTMADEYFQVKRHGDAAVIVPSPEVEHLPENTINTAAQMVLAPLKEDPPTHIIVDLTNVRFFGSAFITFLLRCHLPVKQTGGELVLAGVNDRIRELLRTTALDTLWALYETRSEAMDALVGSD
ncbi:MAG: STAS domain-containing protein [Gemmataceae bacterium]